MTMELGIDSIACINTSNPFQNPLEALIDQEEVNLSQLMNLTDLQSNLDNVSPDFHKKLLNHQQLLKDVMDCALRSDTLQTTDIDATWPYKSVQFLTKQQEEFNKSFFNSSKSEETHSDSGTKTEGSELLEWLFKILESPKPINETSAGYLLKIFNKLYYDNQQEFFWYFINNPQMLASCMQHLYNPSVTDIVWRIADTYNEEMDSKVQLVNTILEAGFSATSFLVETLQNMQTIIESIIQRSQQMNTKKQSVYLCKEVISVRNVNLINDALSKEKVSREALKSFTFILNSFLRFFINQKNPKKDLSSFGSFVDVVTISEQMMESVVLLVRKLFHLWFRNYPRQNKQGSKYAAILVLHSLLKFQPRVAQVLVFENFIDLCILLFKNQPNNNILHNQIRGIIDLSFQTNASKWLVTEKLLLFIIQSFNQIPQPSFINQLFYIAKIINRYEIPLDLKTKQIFIKWNLLLKGKYKEKSDKYTTILARSTTNKKDFFSWQEEVRSQEGEQSSEVVSLKKYSEQDENHPFAQKLKYSTASIDQYEGIEMTISMNLDDLPTALSEIQSFSSQIIEMDDKTKKKEDGE